MKKDKKEYNSEPVAEMCDQNYDNAEELIEEMEEVSEKIDQETDKLKQENARLKDDYLRAYAELENTKRRCALEIEKNSKYAIGSFAKEMLSVADNLHRALEATAENNNTECEQLKKGVELTESELGKVLAKFGVTKMETLGKIFDPSFHQVVQEVEDPSKPAGTVIAELQTGYMINDRLLREAMVIVSK